MKNWLVTASKAIDRTRLAIELQALGCDLPEAFDKPCPLDDDEVYEVLGPDDLPSKLSGKPGIKGVYPNSELTLYD